MRNKKIIQYYEDQLIWLACYPGTYVDGSMLAPAFSVRELVLIYANLIRTELERQREEKRKERGWR